MAIPPLFSTLLRTPSVFRFSGSPRHSGSDSPPEAPPVAAEADPTDQPTDRLHRLGKDLATSRAQTARWQRHADAYARERDSVERERAHLLAWLAALHPSSAVVSQAPAPAPDGAAGGQHFLSLMAGGRTLSWALAPRDAPLFQHVRRARDADTRAWRDAGEIEAQYAHIQRHTRMLALEDDVARVVEELRGNH
ncbi:hypothetical protein OG601_09060 [Streptomyces sp. NBC_01239]|uniref:hypothetical protein n=1 Tax=Streptomyces sp. NBC_01239 TaxID=2903792 RepID=UPI00224F2BC2|nr:hypothetical protein [Streptomyces sp. NBC_01239]MCX4810771.1 hypothetical protein [Streptomyces sp. NBC_01239]